MARYELKLPKMGESVAEATITNWLKKVGETVEAEEGIVEVATDKVDTEVISEVSGVVVEICFQADQVVKVGEVMAIIETKEKQGVSHKIVEAIEKEITEISNVVSSSEQPTENFSNAERFYSPLVKSIAKKEGISLQELEQIIGTGAHNRVTKQDMINYLENRNKEIEASVSKKESHHIRSIR